MTGWSADWREIRAKRPCILGFSPQTTGESVPEQVRRVESMARAARPRPAIPLERFVEPTQGSARTKSADVTTAAIGRLELRVEKARALAVNEPGTVAPHASLREALTQMRARGGDAILVADGTRLAGILTERDVLLRILGNRVDDSQPVSEFMTADPHTLSADASVLEAMQAMDTGHYRNLPLIEADGTVVGLLRQQDMIEYIAEAFPQEILNLPPRPHQLAEQPEGA